MLICVCHDSLHFMHKDCKVTSKGTQNAVTSDGALWIVGCVVQEGKLGKTWMGTDETLKKTLYKFMSNLPIPIAI